MSRSGREIVSKFGWDRFQQVNNYVKSKGAKLTKAESDVVSVLAKLPFNAELKGHQINDIDDVAVRIEKDLGITKLSTPSPGISETSEE